MDGMGETESEARDPTVWVCIFAFRECKEVFTYLFAISLGFFIRKV